MNPLPPPQSSEPAARAATASIPNATEYNAARGGSSSHPLPADHHHSSSSSFPTGTAPAAIAAATTPRLQTSSSNVSTSTILTADSASTSPISTNGAVTLQRQLLEAQQKSQQMQRPATPSMANGATGENTSSASTSPMSIDTSHLNKGAKRTASGQVKSTLNDMSASASGFDTTQAIGGYPGSLGRKAGISEVNCSFWFLDAYEAGVQLELTTDTLALLAIENAIILRDAQSPEWLGATEPRPTRSHYPRPLCASYASIANRHSPPSFERLFRHVRPLSHVSGRPRKPTSDAAHPAGPPRCSPSYLARPKYYLWS
jgi:hypothetical protein